jgi:gliding motility-associated-like protein
LLDNAQDLDNQVYVYVVKANAVDGGLGTSVSNTIKVVKNPNLFYPTAFTPDHQGPAENEAFRVFGQYVQEFEMKIFNRWGELLYSTSNLNDSWDGTFKGAPMPEGTYAFIATITDDIGRTFHRSGSVVLLRKN